MVRSIAAIVAVLLIVVGGIALELYTTHTLDTLEDHLRAIESGGSFSLEQTEKTITWWQKQVKMLEMFVLHDPLHEVDALLAEIKGAIIYEPTSAGIALEKALSAKENLLHQHKLSISNVF